MNLKRSTLGWVLIGWAVLAGQTLGAQTLDPMRPSPSQLSQLTIPANSLAAAIMAAQQGGPAIAELVNVLKAREGQVSAVLEAAGLRDAADLQQATAAKAVEGGLVLRTSSGDRTLSPNPLVQKTPRPVGSPPTVATAKTRESLGEQR